MAVLLAGRRANNLYKGMRNLRLLSITANEDHFTLVQKDTIYNFLYQWLRDHCRHPHVYNHSTNQRSVNLLDFSDHVKPKHYDIDGDQLRVTWDDGHESVYGVSWLLSHHVLDRSDAFRVKHERLLWKRDTFPWESALIPSERVLHSSSGPVSLAKSILVNGFGVVTGVEPTTAATRAVVEALAPVAGTVYGDMYTLTAEAKEKVSDSSYSNVGLECHTDTTYYLQAYGLQVFHCIEKATGGGGETLLVDGFHVANSLRHQYPQTYKFLSSFPLEAEYVHVGGGNAEHFLCVSPSLIHDEVSGEIQQFRYNVYDRSLHRMTIDEQREFYGHYRKLAAEVRKEDNTAKVSLSPGQVLLLDNWRTLHGRTSFCGSRTITGCYVGRAEFMSRARVMGLV